jgi:hypothetical protein
MRLVLMAIAAGGMMTMPTAADEPALRQAVLLYASFDREVRADHGGGG